MNVEKLPIVFDGKGEVKEIIFEQFHKTENYYIYFRSDGNYELFERRSVPVCIDFENRVYSETEKKEVYPKAKDFGNWAWTFKAAAFAVLKLNELNERR